MNAMRAFFEDVAVPRIDPDDGRVYTVLDVGSLRVGKAKAYREMVEEVGKTRGIRLSYIGLDIVSGPNVDVVASNPYRFFDREMAFDFVISGQTMEHVLQPIDFMHAIYKVTASGGIVCIIAPSEGKIHHKPDYWRIKPDAMQAMFDIAGFHTLSVALIGGRWNDCVGIAQKY